jgi:hypothetical protein
VISHHSILCDDLDILRVTQHSDTSICVLAQHQRDYYLLSICGNLIDSVDKDKKFLNGIIGGGETLSFLYDPQLKRQWATWKSPSSSRNNKLRQDRSRNKVMLELFSDSSATVHVESFPEGAGSK